jgi:hypothetical protein
MEADLIDFDNTPDNSIVNSYPRYYDLESEIVEQNKKIEILEKTIEKMKDSIEQLTKPREPDAILLELHKNMNILQTMHNNFCIQINYIDYNPEYCKNMSIINSSRGDGTGYVAQIVYKGGFKTKTIPIMCEILDISDIIVDDFSLSRLRQLCNLKTLITNEIRYIVVPSKRVVSPTENRELNHNETVLIIYRESSFEKNGDVAYHFYDKTSSYFRQPPKITVVQYPTVKMQK